MMDHMLCQADLAGTGHAQEFQILSLPFFSPFLRSFSPSPLHRTSPLFSSRHICLFAAIRNLSVRHRWFSCKFSLHFRLTSAHANGTNQGCVAKTHGRTRWT